MKENAICLSKRAKAENRSALLEERDLLQRILAAVDQEADENSSEPTMGLRHTSEIQKMLEGNFDSEVQNFMSECTVNDAVLLDFLRTPGVEKFFSLAKVPQLSDAIITFTAEITDRDSAESNSSRLLVEAIGRSTLADILADMVVSFPQLSDKDSSFLFTVLCCIENILELDPGFQFRDARLLDSLIRRATNLESQALYASELLSTLAESQRHLQFVTSGSLETLFNFLDKIVETDKPSPERHETTENLLNFLELCSLNEETASKISNENHLMVLVHVVKIKNAYSYKALRIISALALKSRTACKVFAEKRFYAILVALLSYSESDKLTPQETGNSREYAVHTLSVICLKVAAARQRVISLIRNKETYKKLAKIYEESARNGDFALAGDAAILLAEVLGSNFDFGGEPLKVDTKVVSELRLIKVSTSNPQLKEYVDGLIRKLNENHSQTPLTTVYQQEPSISF